MIAIREAVGADAGALHVLGGDVAEFSVNEATVSFWPEEILQKATESDDVVVFVAEEEDGAMAGFIIAAYVEGLRKATIENIYVTPDVRGQGIGEALLRQLLAALQVRGCQYVATLVPADADGAIRLYTEAGFERGEVFLWLDMPLTDVFKAWPCCE